MEELFVMFDTRTALECKNKWYDLMNKIGLESNIRHIGILKEKDVDEIVNNVNDQRLNNNPIQFKKEYFQEIFF